MKYNTTIPAHIAKLLIEFFGDNLLTNEERDMLDEWVCASDQNMHVFDEMVDMVETRKEEFWRYPPDMDRAMPFYSSRQNNQN